VIFCPRNPTEEMNTYEAHEKPSERGYAVG
jgi:hypothetical protein